MLEQLQNAGTTFLAFKHKLISAKTFGREQIRVKNHRRGVGGVAGLDVWLRLLVSLVQDV